MTRRTDAPGRRGHAGGPVRRDHPGPQGPTRRIRDRDRRRDTHRTSARHACTCPCSGPTRSAGARWTRSAVGPRLPAAARRRPSCGSSTRRRSSFLYDDTAERADCASSGCCEEDERGIERLSQRDAVLAELRGARPLPPVHPRAPGRRRARLAGGDAAGADGARQGRGRVHGRRRVPAALRVPLHPASSGSSPRRPADLDDRTVVFLDCGNIDRNPADALKRDGAHILNIDHHHDNTRFGTVNLVDAGRVLHRRDGVGPDARRSASTLTRAIAEALYVGLVTDTGKFMYENTGPAAHRMAAELHRGRASTSRRSTAGSTRACRRPSSTCWRAGWRTCSASTTALLTLSHLTPRPTTRPTGAEASYSEGVVDHLRALEGTASPRSCATSSARAATARRKVSLRASDDRVDVSRDRPRPGRRRPPPRGRLLDRVGPAGARRRPAPRGRRAARLAGRRLR